MIKNKKFFVKLIIHNWKVIISLLIIHKNYQLLKENSQKKIQ